MNAVTHRDPTRDMTVFSRPLTNGSTTSHATPHAGSRKGGSRFPIGNRERVTSPGLTTVTGFFNDGHAATPACSHFSPRDNRHKVDSPGSPSKEPEPPRFPPARWSD